MDKELIMESVNIGVKGMTCTNCATGLERKLNRLDSVKATLNFAAEQAAINFDSKKTDLSALVSAIESSGYIPVLGETTLDVTGMTCANCAKRLEKNLMNLEGVLSANVNLATQSATISYLPEYIAVKDFKATAQKIGYSLHENETISAVQVGDREGNQLKRDALIASFLAAPLLLLEMLPMLIPNGMALREALLPKSTFVYLSFALATLVQFGPGLRFYKLGLPSLLSGAPDMNSLVMLGSSSAYFYSLIATFLPQILPEGTVHVYYEASASIIAIILVGRWLEQRTKGKSGQAIEKLLSLQAKTAYVWRGENWQTLPINEVRVGDIIQVKPGEKIPLDGVVKNGSSYLDESMLTGEAKAVNKQVGEEIMGGTINKTGSFEFEVTKVGNDTVLAQIVKTVKEAQGSKLPIQAIADKVVAVFVPIILIIAAFTFIIWLIWGPSPNLNYALVVSAAVLLIACPCAMGLATPISIMVGSGRAANMGVFFRKGEALQALQNVQIIAFDKTGTLTKGTSELTNILLEDGFDEREVLGLVASLEQKSEHPIAEALVKEANIRDLVLSEVESFRAIPGYGIEGIINAKKVQIGSRRFIQDLGLSNLPSLDWAKEGKTVVHVAVNGEFVATLAVADTLKENTKQTLEALNLFGIKTVMITGDNNDTARAIANDININEIYAEVLPNDKVSIIRALNARGATVAFVGDGINDAPALASADVGIAIGTGTDIAIEAADVVLMSGNLEGVLTALSISKATLRNIKQNLFWAFIYNIVLIPVAAGALYPSFGILLSPMFAAVAMGLSDLFVVGNALRLQHFHLSKFIKRDNPKIILVGG